MNLLTEFDRYNRNARIYPALLLFLPLMFSIASTFPEIIISNQINLFISIATACGGLYFLSSVCRSAGKRREKTLITQWGGLPTTQWLRHCDNRLNSSTKARYHTFFNNHVPGLTIPSASEEMQDPEKADEKYCAAVEWLREQRRDKDKFSLIHEENIQYGFCRNLLGVKSLGVLFCLVSLLVLIFGTFFKFNIYANLVENARILLALQLTLSAFSTWTAIAAFVDILAIFCWLFIVNENWVREAGDQYACRLLASCDFQT